MVIMAFWEALSLLLNVIVYVELNILEVVPYPEFYIIIYQMLLSRNKYLNVNQNNVISYLK
jgi:hypothetical protein